MIRWRGQIGDRRWLRGAALALWLGGGLGVGGAAAAEPADNAIKAAIYDLERAGQQIPGLTPSRQANIKRVLRSLDLAEERLLTSTNQDHPSWIEANEQLQTYRARLNDLLAGNTPATTATPAPAPAPTTGQAAPAAPAQSAPAPTQTETPTAPATQAAAQLPSSERSHLGRLERAVTDTLNALAGLHPVTLVQPEMQQAFAQAIARDQEAFGRFQPYQADPTVAAVGARIALATELHQGALAGTPPKQILAGRGIDVPDPQIQLTDANRRMLGELTNASDRTLRELGQTDPFALQDQALLEQWQARVAGLQDGVATLAPLEAHPPVASLRQKVEEASAQLEQRAAAAAQHLAELGDVEAGIAAIEQRYGHASLPVPLEPPITAAAIDAFAPELITFAQQLERDRAWLQAVAGRTDHFGIPLTNALNGTVGSATSAFERAILRTRELILEPTLNLGRIEFAAGADYRDPNQAVNLLLGRGEYEGLVAEIDQAEQAIALANRLETTIGLPATDHGALAQQLAGWRASLEAAFTAALANARMPAAKSDDAELLANAAEALRGSEYGSQKWARMVINSDLRTNKEERAYLNDNVATFYTYDWDEFQVATAEPSAHGYVIYYNDISFYRSGDRTIPLNRWFLSNRFESGRILEGNIDRDD